MTEAPPTLPAMLASFREAPSPEDLHTTRTIAPRTPSEVALVLGSAAAEDATAGFAGSGSSLELGGLRAYDVGIVSSGMSEIIDWQPDDLTVVVGAGISVGHLQDELASRRQTALLPVDDPRRTVGGVVAEGASAISRLKYGPTRDRVLEVTLATGYGEVVRGGGRLVKNVTGYDMPRLATGSMGSLGFITSVCLKLWPSPPVHRVVRVDDAASALATLFRPLAVLETDSGHFVHLEGSAGDVTAQTSSAGGETVGGAHGPAPIDLPVVASVRVASRSLTVALDIVRGAAPMRWIAQHGVGIIEAGWSDLDHGAFADLRGAIEVLGGRAVLRRGGSHLDGMDSWGAQPGTQAIQQRLKDLFDPAAVCNPGKLPGGI
jgi:glycolate oxidase FAD binding subunit